MTDKPTESAVDVPDAAVALQNAVDSLIHAFVDVVGSVAVTGHLPRTTSTTGVVDTSADFSTKDDGAAVASRLAAAYASLTNTINTLPDIDRSREDQIEELRDLAQRNVEARLNLESAIDDAQATLDRLNLARSALAQATRHNPHKQQT